MTVIIKQDRWENLFLSTHGCRHPPPNLHVARKENDPSTAVGSDKVCASWLIAVCYSNPGDTLIVTKPWAVCQLGGFSTSPLLFSWQARVQTHSLLQHKAKRQTWCTYYERFYNRLRGTEVLRLHMPAEAQSSRNPGSRAKSADYLEPSTKNLSAPVSVGHLKVWYYLIGVVVTVKRVPLTMIQCFILQVETS